MNRSWVACQRKHPRRWTVHDWERSWEVALRRIDGAPSVMKGQQVFQESLAALDHAFANGNNVKFEQGLITLLDFCAEAVNLGNYEQWW